MAAADLAAAILADSPKAYYKCQETGVGSDLYPLDASGNGLDMNAKTSLSTGFVYGQTGWSLLGDKMIVLAGGRSLWRTTQVSTVVANFTAEFVIQIQATGNGQGIFYNGNGGSNGWGILANSDGTIQPLLGGVAGLTKTNTVLTIGTSSWYHVFFVKRAAGTSPEIWINGVKDTAVQGTTAPRAPSGTTNINGNTGCQAGYSHVAIYETALSSTRIAAHWTALQAAPSTAIKTILGVSYPTNVKTVEGLAQASVKTVEGLA